MLPRVLQALGSHHQPAVMPVDLAMCLSLSQRQPLYQLLSMAPLKPKQHHYQQTDCPQRTSHRSPHHSVSSPYPTSSSLPSSTAPSGPRSCFRKDSTSPNKKRVVFADAKGLALTAVHLFIPEPSSVSTLLMKPPPAKLQGQQPISNKQQRYKLRLGFPQPTLDLKAFLARLRETRVQLESCSILEHTLRGKVCVSHASVEKAVNIRVTFNSWRSYHDIPCTFLQQQRCGGSDMDVFAFELSLLKKIDPKERVEFCVYLKPGPGITPHWDDNRGLNYRVCIEKDGLNANQGDAHYSYQKLSQNRPPSWPSTSWPSHVSLNVQNSAELQYLQRSLSSRVTAEWKALCTEQ